MNLPVVCLLIGGGLLALALLGGGVKIRDYVVPRIGARLRALAGVLAVPFAAGGVFLYAQGPEPMKAVAAPVVQAPRLVTIHIEKVLGEGQLSEQVLVLLNAQLVGSVTVSEHHRSAEVRVAVLGEGRHKYQLVGDCAYRDADGVKQYAKGMEAGYLDVEDGATYVLKGELVGSRWRAEIFKKTV